MAPNQPRTRLYVDGFNLYYGSLKNSPYKWLDLEKLARQLAPTLDVVGIRYFTAHVSGKLDPDAPMRQKAYLLALSALPTVTAHFGQFRTREVSMPLANPSPAGPRFASVLKTEEKGSDVNLASYLLLDGVDRLWDVAIVISNDSDLAEPIRLAADRFGEVRVYNPHRSINAVLQRVASRYRALATPVLASAQFPATVPLPDGSVVTKPAAW